MSDEVPPAPLKLKPRVKSDGENAAPAPADSASTVSEASATAGSPRLKLRPKLDLTPPVANSTTEPAPAPPSSPTPPSLGLKPRLVIAQPDTIPSSPVGASLPGEAPPPVAPPPVQAEQPKFKLKDKAATASNSFPAPPAPVAAPPILAPAAQGRATTVPPFPVVANPPAAKPPATLPPPKVKPAKEPGEVAAADPGQSSFAKVILVVAAFVLIIGVYYGYKKLTAEPANAEPPVAQAAERPASPSKTLNDLGAMPAQAIAKAEAVVATVNKNEEGRVDEVLVDQPMPVRPPRKVAPKPVEKTAATTSTTDLAPGIKATTTAKDVDGDANPAFRAWVAQARVSGVFQGTPARVLINGKTVAAGQIVDETLEITFEGVDSNAKLLIFRDASGVSVTRKF